MIRAAVILAVLWPAGALACACCAERGERFAYDMELGAYEMDQLGQVAAQGPAHLFLTACGTVCVKGIDDPQERYAVALETGDGAVTLVLGDEGGQARGRIVFTMPQAFTYAGVDTDPLSESRSVALYTELRFRGRAEGQGDFAGGMAELVISGRGNMCIGAGGFDHWRLEVHADGVDYRLFGGLGRK